MKLTIANLAEILNGRVIGNDNEIVRAISKIEEAQEGDITFLANSKYLPWLYKTKASAVIVNEDLNLDLNKSNIPNLILVKDSYSSFNKLLIKFSKNKIKHFGIHKFSDIHESTFLDKSVSVDKFSVIGSDCKIEANVVIMDNVTIQNNVSIGKNCIIYSGVRIYNDSIIGNNCVLHSNSVIGSDGFGYVPNDQGEYIKIPQLGNVKIGNKVEIGSNSSIDRATLGSTLISDGVKIDNLVQIAHNVSIGKNTVIAGQCGIAGSTKIGKNCQIGGQVGIIGHLNIGDNVKINGKTGVFSNIKDNAILKGTPAIDQGVFNRSYVHFRNLDKIVKDINELKKLNGSNN